MKKNYLVSAFQKTAAERFPDQAERLNWALEKRMAELWEENADASPQERSHLESQIIPGIAAYQVLQTVLPKEEALSTLHGYVEERAWKLRKAILRLLRLPGFYRLVPGLFAKGTRKLFGPAAGFAAKELEVTKSVWRIDMTRCPYHDACVRYGCPELCPSFCDSDDITYGGLHPRLLWRRTETLGWGGGRCDFCLRLREPPTQERSDPPCW